MSTRQLQASFILLQLSKLMPTSSIIIITIIGIILRANLCNSASLYSNFRERFFNLTNLLPYPQTEGVPEQDAKKNIWVQMGGN